MTFDALKAAGGASASARASCNGKSASGPSHRATSRRPRALEARRDALLRLGIGGILFREIHIGRRTIVFAKACEMGIEGIVSKRAGSRYWSANSTPWVKSRNPEFVRGESDSNAYSLGPRPHRL
jgi:hypothetical protein